MTLNTEARRVKLELLLNDYLRTLESLEKTGEVSLEGFPFLQSLFTPSAECNGFTLIDALFLSKVAEALKEFALLKG